MKMRSIRYFLLVAIGLSPPMANSGATVSSLYPGGNAVHWLSDTRAQRIGDALTVLVLENASAESRAGSSEQNDFGLEAGISDTFNSVAGTLNIGQNGSGKGVTSRTGSVRARLTVQVVNVLENNDLRVQGAQSITVNGEEQRILLEGVVRHVDIGADNTVVSNRLMNARIFYSGHGWISESQKPSWFRKIFRFLGL